MKGLSLCLAMLAALLIPFFGYSQGLNTGLILHYPLNGNADDISPNNFDGTISGASPVADRFGVEGGAMQFTGSSFIDFPANPALKPQPPLSISVWVWLDAIPAGGRVLLSTDFVPNAFFGLTIGLDAANRLQLTLGGAQSPRTLNGTTPLVTNRWHHVVVVLRSLDELELFLSGCPEQTADAGQIPLIAYSPSGRGSLGRGNAGTPPALNNLRGRLDDFRYWNRALSEEEVNRLYGRFYTPPLSLGPDTMICIGETLALRPQTTLNNYSWSDGSNREELEVSQTGSYSVSANTDDCQMIGDTIEVMVGFCDNCEPARPNAFTPNGDGKNDRFRLLFDPNKCRISDAHVMIFTRWGKLIYESDDVQTGWDGRSGNTDLPSDVYVYVIRYAYDAEEGRINRQVKGDVTLIR